MRIVIILSIILLCTLYSDTLHFVEAEQRESSSSDDNRAFDCQAELCEWDTHPARRENGEEGERLFLT